MRPRIDPESTDPEIDGLTTVLFGDFHCPFEKLIFYYEYVPIMQNETIFWQWDLTVKIYTPIHCY